VNFSADPEDGLFWMTFEDLCKYFFSVNVSIQHCLSILGNGNRQHSHRIARSSWNDYRTPFMLELFPSVASSESLLLRTDRLPGQAFRVSVPIYIVTVSSDNTIVYASVHQRDHRDHVDGVAGPSRYIDLGLTVLRINKTATSLSYEYVDAVVPSVDRQVQTEELELSRGDYMFVPTSSGSLLLWDYVDKIENEQLLLQPLLPLVEQGQGGDVLLSHQLEELLEGLFDR
jgi:hypothetical protein